MDAATAAMFEDMPHNLEAPHALGMTTVLVQSDRQLRPSRAAEDPRLDRAARARAPHDRRPGRFLATNGADPRLQGGDQERTSERLTRESDDPMTDHPAPEPLAGPPPGAPIADGTRIGHVHLKVADLERALSFYCGVLASS